MCNKKYLLICCLFLLLITACSPSTIISTSNPSPESTDQDSDIIIYSYPPEFLIYKDYLEVIKGYPDLYQDVIIEATVVSINAAVVCPYQEEDCPIEPYPRVFGEIEINSILSESENIEGNFSLPQEAVGLVGNEEGQTSPENLGYPPITDTKEPIGLVVGQIYQALFVLTTEPVIVQYMPISAISTTGNEGVQQENGEDSISQPMEQQEKEYFPIPSRNRQYIFTTQIGDYEETVVKSLPGLEIGSRFQARVYYNNQFYIYEYALVP